MYLLFIIEPLHIQQLGVYKIFKEFLLSNSVSESTLASEEIHDLGQTFFVLR